MFVATTRIRIEAPDATAASLLERRLDHLGATTVEHDGAWGVELAATTDRLDDIAPALRLWLQEIDRLPLGAGYDEASLEHEP